MQKNDDKRGKNRSYAACSARGIAIGLAVILLLFAVLSTFVASGKIPEKAMPVLLFITALVGAFLGAVAAIKSHGSKAMAIGLTVSGALFALTLIGAAFSEDAALIGPLTPGLLFCLAAGGILAAMLSLRRKKRR